VSPLPGLLYFVKIIKYSSRDVKLGSIIFEGNHRNFRESIFTMFGTIVYNNSKSKNT